MKSFFLATLIAILLVGCESPTTQPVVVEATDESTPGQAAPEEAAKQPAPTELNPVQHEMQLLTVAMKNSLDAIANNNLAIIPGEIAKVHPAKVATSKAIEAGTYKAPFNADKMNEFAELDEVFHDQLRDLLGAAKKNDTGAAAAAYGQLVQGCANCHATYRFAPDTTQTGQ